MSTTAPLPVATVPLMPIHAKGVVVSSNSTVFPLTPEAVKVMPVTGMVPHCTGVPDFPTWTKRSWTSNSWSGW